MESKTLTVHEALTTAINLLETIQVKGHTNTSNISKAEELIAKVIQYMEEQAKAQTEPSEDVEPVELGPVVLEDPTESAKE